MFGLIPTFTNNLATNDNSFKSIFDVFNEPFFQNAFAPVNSMFNAFKVDVKIQIMLMNSLLNYQE